MAQRAEHPRAAFEDAAQVLSDSASRTFDAEGRPRWTPRVDNDPHPILNLTGNLSDATEDTQHGGGSIVRIDDTSLEFGTDVEYGKYHQSDAPRTRLPRRPFLMFQPEDIGTLIGLFRAFLWWDSRS